jgi:hypothetical protein
MMQAGDEPDGLSLLDMGKGLRGNKQDKGQKQK